MKLTRSRRSHRLFWKLLVGLVIIAYVAAAFIKPLPAITFSTTPLATTAAHNVSLPWPAYGEAAFGAVGYGVLATHGTQTPLPTASIAKIMTALCVLKEKPLNTGQQGPTLTITQADVDSYQKYVAEDGSVVPVSVGEQFTEYQALQAMLLPSANNMAETLARWAFGSIDAYTAYANDYAKTLRLNSVTITDPSGFLPTTVASAQDLTSLGLRAIQNPVIADIVDQPSAVLPTTGTIHNVNMLLGSHGTIGIKTGNNDQDKGAYLFAAKQSIGGQSVTVVGTIMDGPDLGTALWDSLPIIDSTANNFSPVTSVNAGETVGAYHIPWQGDVPARIQQSLHMAAWNGSPVQRIAILEDTALATRPNRRVGVVSVTNGVNSKSQTVPVVLSTTIQKPSLWWRLSHVF